MADHHSKKHSHDFLHTLVGFRTIRRTCKSLVTKCHTIKNPSFSKKADHRTNQEDSTKSPRHKNWNFGDRYLEEDEISPEIHDSGLKNLLKNRFSFRSSSKHNGFDEYAKKSFNMSRRKSPTLLTEDANHNHFPLSRSTSHRSRAMTPNRTSSFMRTKCRTRSTDSIPDLLTDSFSRSTSRRNPNIIMFSNSNGVMKPPPTEKQLDCTLEELCFGSVKQVKVTKDTVTDDRQILEEVETLTIKVKPGWRTGTKITFAGMGVETPGTDPADVIFTISEKQHPLFRRQGDDLELGVEIPLVDALTGCTISVPLLGGQMMSLTVDDVICPGDEKIIAGEGMPKYNEPETRGNLKITFLVEFPEELIEQQRDDVVNILQHTPY